MDNNTNILRHLILVYQNERADRYPSASDTVQAFCKALEDTCTEHGVDIDWEEAFGERHPFVSVGDVIKQKHQRGAPNRTVVSLTDDPDVVVAFDPEQNRLVNVLAWGHELVHKATDDTLHEALRLRSSEQFPKNGARPI